APPPAGAMIPPPPSIPGPPRPGMMPAPHMGGPPMMPMMGPPPPGMMPVGPGKSGMGSLCQGGAGWEGLADIFRPTICWELSAGLVMFCVTATPAGRDYNNFTTTH
uniref:Uncharacterized protein n=1 Tax=Catharus ustulatus TaxID=91951 RepID=A0A8C3V580_CATUS